jgi:hypothetical protein
MAIKRREPLAVQKKFDLEAVQKELIAFSTNQTETQIKENIKTLYEAYSANPPETVDEINNTIKSAYIHASYFSFLIGDVLLNLRERIEKGKSSFQSLNKYFDENIDNMGISAKMCYDYLRIRENYTFDQYLILGFNNAINGLKIKDESLKETFIEWVEQNPKANNFEVENYINEQIGNEKEEINRRKKKELAKINKSVVISNEISKNKIILIFSNPEEREIAEMFFDKYIIKLKNDILKELKARNS